MTKDSKTIIRISVRALVEFILREGNIEGAQGGFKDREAMQAGSRIHRKLQNRMDADYRAEYALKESFDCGEFVIQVEGRADGIWTKEEEVVVDEIKGVYRDLERLEKPEPLHLAQAKVYACIYAGQHGLEEISVRMTYVNLDTEEIRYFYENYRKEELEAWFLPVIRKYEKWARFQYEWRLVRQDSIRKLEFPFPYRKGQKELAAAVYRTIYHGRRLFIQAPTGVGKTLSTVFPAVKAVGEGLADKLFYLTAKTVTRTVAEEAFSILGEGGLSYKFITLTAKEKLCACEEMICDPARCGRAKGHYDRVNEAVFALINEQDHITRTLLEEYAARYQVCPFEFLLDAAVWCDGIICDYNYVFDPRVRLKRFFGEGQSGEYLFLVDEAHNLVERGRSMFSARLCKEDFLEVRRMVRPYRPKLEKKLEAANRQLLILKRECKECEVVENIDGFILQLMNVASEMEKYLEELQQGELRDRLLEFYFDLRGFLSIYDRLDENYVIYTELKKEGEGRGEGGNFYLKLFCVNPAVNLGEVFAKGVSSILFSATLLPIDYYQTLLSDRDDDYAVYAPSPFPKEHKRILVASDVTSKYTRRTKQEYEKIAAYIHQIISCKKGNYLVFFPSYRFLEEVYQCMEREETEDLELLLQNPQMDENAREQFLEAFHRERTGTLAGFCVIGGIFGEGIDLKGERLIGAIVVGTGLAQIDHEGELLKAYYDQRQQDGFAYAYRYPGMNKVLQAAGRVIRTMEDKGVVLLLDQRFLQQEYRRLFPREWEDYRRCTLETAKEETERFWLEAK